MSAVPSKQELDEIRKLTSDDYREVAVDLNAALSNTVASGTDTYQVPTTHKFVIRKVLPHLVITDPATETAFGSGIAGTAYSDHEKFKASNCRVTLTNTESNEKLMGENNPVPLSALLSDPVDWGDMPHIVSPGAVLQLDVSLVSSGISAYVGGTTEYGVVLVGALVRVRAS